TRVDRDRRGDVDTPGQRRRSIDVTIPDLQHSGRDRSEIVWGQEKAPGRRGCSERDRTCQGSRPQYDRTRCSWGGRRDRDPVEQEYRIRQNYDIPGGGRRGGSTVDSALV